MSFIWLYKNSLAAQLKLIVHFCKGQAELVSNSAACEEEALVEAGYSLPFLVAEYFRFVYQGNTYTSRQYTRERKSNDTVMTVFYVIERIVEVSAPL